MSRRRRLYNLRVSSLLRGMVYDSLRKDCVQGTFQEMEAHLRPYDKCCMLPRDTFCEEAYANSIAAGLADEDGRAEHNRYQLMFKKQHENKEVQRLCLEKWERKKPEAELAKRAFPGEGSRKRARRAPAAEDEAEWEQTSSSAVPPWQQRHKSSAANTPPPWRKNRAKLQKCASANADCKCATAPA